METIKWQTELCMAVWLQVKICGHGLSLWPIGRTPVVSVTSKSRGSCSMWFVAIYECYMPHSFWAVRGQ